MPAALPLIAGAFLAAGSVATAVGLGTAFVVAGLAITWTAVLTITGVALMAVAYLARKTPKPESAGQQLQQKLDPQAPVPIAFGRTATGGYITWRGTWGKKNALYGIVTVLSAGGPIQGIESYRAGDYPIGFNFSPSTMLATCINVGGYSGKSKLYKGKLRQRWVPGNAPANTTPASLTGYPIPAGSMSGLAHAITSFEYETDAFPQGLPASLWTLNGVKLYDPRKDSTYPGGSGAQRVDQPATWTFNENPYLAALQWTLGRYENGKRVYGIGARWSEVDVASFVNGANVADANGWKVGGVVSTSDDKYSVLASLLTCGSGVPVARGAQIACSVNAPKTAVLSLTKEDIIGEVEISSTTSWRDRQNTIIPRYREESQNWEIISGERLSAATYVAEDGGETKTVEIEFPLVQQAKQAHQLAAYELVNSREFLTFTVNAKMRLIAARVGDAIMVNVPQIAASSTKCTVAGREFNPSDLSVTLTLKSETDAKHAYALGQTQVAPPSPKLDGYDPSNPEAPASTAWAITATAIKNDTVTLPAIVVTGAADDPNAATVIFEYRPLGSSEWLNGGEYPRTTNRVELTSVTTGTAYEVAVSYRTNLNVIGERLILGATAGDMKVDWQTIVDGPGKPEDSATVGAPEWTTIGDKPVPDVLEDIDDAKGNAQTAVDALKKNAGQIIPVKDILVDISDLQETFGDTVSASAARDAALASQNAAKISEDNAKVAKDQSQAARDAANLAKDDARAKANAAAVSATDAGGFATTASGQATIATQKADASGQSATIADGKAQIATTKAGEASVSASNAASSSDSAGQSASTATLQAGVSSRAAAEGAANVANANRSPGAAPSLWSYNDYNNFYPTTRLPATSIGDFSYTNSVLRLNSGIHVHPVEPTRIEPSKRYRASVRFRLVQDGPQPNGHSVYVTYWNAEGQLLADNTLLVNQLASTTVAAGWVEISAVISSDGRGGSVKWPANTAFMRVMFRTSGAPTEVALLYLEDVDSKLAANDSAVAAAGSASTAATMSDSAGQSASAANTSAANAVTKAGEASVSASNAATSENNAKGSANAASSNATLSATSSAAALSAAISTIPSSFTQGGDFWSVDYGGAETRPSYFGANYTFDKGASTVTMAGTGSPGQLDIAPRGSVALVEGRTRRLTMRWQVLFAAGNYSVTGFIYFIGMRADGVPVETPGKQVSLVSGGKGWGTENGYESHTYEIADSDLIAEGAVRMRGLARFICAVGTEQFKLADFSLDDITSEVASAGSAAASVVSASTASTKADAAGQSAAAANQSKLDAQAANGAASGSASAASGSAATAGAHASAAALSSKLTAAFSATRGLTPNGSFETGPEGWSATSNMVWAPNYYRGPGFQAVNSYGSMSSAKPIRVDTTRKYRLSSMLVNHGPNPATVYVGITCLDNNMNFLGNIYMPQFTWGAQGPTMPPGSVQPAVNDITGESGTAPVYGHAGFFVTGTVYVQLIAFLNYPSPQPVAGTQEINYLYLEDVTSEKAAETQAGIATASAATATAQSSSAQNSANLSATYRDQSAGYRDESKSARDTAIAQAGVASSQAAVATTQAALSTTSATVSASVGSGLANKGSTFSVWPDGQAIPSYWTNWGDASNAKLPGIVGRYGFQQYAAANATETGLQATLATDDGFTSLKSGTYIVDAEVTLDGGSFPGAGVLFRGFDAYGSITNDCYNSFAAIGSDVSPDAPTGNGVAGSRYRFTQMFTLPPNTNSCMIYLMTQWAGFGARNEKRITWHRVGVRRATQAETQSGKVADINARVTTQSGAIAVLNGKNMAWMQTEAIAGDGRAIVSLRADGQTGSSNIDLAASQIRLINSAGGVLSPTLSVQNGNVTIAGDLYMGAGRIVSTNGAFMKVQGTGFGTANQFLEWFGPNMQISSCSEANAKSYSKTNGDTYFGGSLSAGKLTNAVQTTMQAYDASVTTGGFGSNGGARVVTVSYTAASSSQVINQCPTPYTPYATVRLYRGTNASGTLLSEQTFNGTHNCSPGAGQFEPGYMTDSISGTITYTDNTGGLSSSYFAQIVGRNIMTTNLSQGLGIISIEQ